MTPITPLSAPQWHGLLAAAGTTPRPIGLPIHTDAPARALCAEGLGSMTVYRAGQLDYGTHWAERPCACTDNGRNQPLMNCPHCRGEGVVKG